MRFPPNNHVFATSLLLSTILLITNTSFGSTTHNPQSQSQQRMQKKISKNKANRRNTQRSGERRLDDSRKKISTKRQRALIAERDAAIIKHNNRMKALHARRRDPGLSSEQVAQVNREIQQEELAHRKHLTSLNELAKTFVAQANTGKKTHIALKKKKNKLTPSTPSTSYKKNAASMPSKVSEPLRSTSTSSIEPDNSHSVIDEADDIDYDEDILEADESLDVPPVDIESDDEPNTKEELIYE